MSPIQGTRLGRGRYHLLWKTSSAREIPHGCAVGWLDEILVAQNSSRKVFVDFLFGHLCTCIVSWVRQNGKKRKERIVSP